MARMARRNVAGGCRAQTDQWYISYGDIKHDELKPYQWSLLDNPHTKNEPIIFCEGEADCEALIELGFVATNHKSLVRNHIEKGWYTGRDIIVVEDRDPPSSATTGGGYGYASSTKTPGERHAERARKLLSGTAKQLAVFRFPGTGVKDARDWVRAHPGSATDKVEALRPLFKQCLDQQEGVEVVYEAPAEPEPSLWLPDALWKAQFSLTRHSDCGL